MRQRVVRLLLAAGAAVLVLVSLLMACGGSGSDGGDGTRAQAAPGSAARVAPPPTQLTVPSAYDPDRGWEITDSSPEYALAGAASRLAYLERAGAGRFRLRTLDPSSGNRGWDGAPWRSLFAPGRFPRLLSVTKDDREYFVTWSYGKLAAAASAPTAPVDAIVSLDVYDAATGSRRRVEVPWPEAPVVTAAGSGILISDGKATVAAVDPANGEVAGVAPAALGYPNGCPGCRRLTEVRAVTDRGLLVGGAAGFWVRGGWFSRTVAPQDTAPDSGVPASVARGHVLAKWQRKKGAADAATHDVWAVHDLATGQALVQVRCRRPAIAPGDEPLLIASPSGRYLIAGRLAFDLDTRTGHCFEEPDGTAPLTLTTVADDGTAYGAVNARSAADALAGGGRPVEVDLATGTPEPLAPGILLPVGAATGMGLFSWTDTKDRPRLTAYARRE